MRLRALIFDDEDTICFLLKGMLEHRGYEVFTFTNPGLCPLHIWDNCQCTTNEACADIIISDLNMPNVKGLDFVEKLMNKGCKCMNIALMSGNWSDTDISRAAKLGCKVLAKPFHLSQVNEWLDEVEARIDPNRKLSEWFIKSSTTEQIASGGA